MSPSIFEQWQPTKLTFSIFTNTTIYEHDGAQYMHYYNRLLGLQAASLLTYTVSFFASIYLLAQHTIKAQ